MTTQESAPTGVHNHLSDAALAEIGTLVWRLHRRLGEHHAQDRLAQRHIEELWDTLVGAGLEVRDHTDQPLPEGGSYGLRVLAFQPTPNLTREQVLATVKPSVFFQGRLLQMGQVIVGVPATSEESVAPPEEEGHE